MPEIIIKIKRIHRLLIPLIIFRYQLFLINGNDVVSYAVKVAQEQVNVDIINRLRYLLIIFRGSSNIQ